MKLPALTAIALLLALGTTQAAPLVPANLPADAQWVVHVDLEQVRSSTLGKAVHAKLAKHEKFTNKIKEVTEKLGMNPTKDLLGVTLFDTSYGSHQGVVLIHCHKLNKKKLVSAFEKKHPEHKSSKYGDWTLYHWTSKMGRHGEHAISGTFANDHTIALCGDADKLKKALDVIRGKSKSASSDSELLAGLIRRVVIRSCSPDCPRSRCWSLTPLLLIRIT